MAEKTNTFEKHSGVTGFFLFTIVFVFLDLLLGYLFIPENFQSFRIPDSYYHHGIEPGYSGITNWGQIYYRFCSNNLGFRDAEAREVPVQSDRKRILFLGDSHTEAVGVDFGDSFVGLLADRLKDSNTEVLNASAVSYSPKIYYLKAEYLIEEVGLIPDEIFVILDMSDLNNEIAYQYFVPVRQSGFSTVLHRYGRKLSRHSLTSCMVSLILKKQRNKFFYKNIYKAENADFELYATFFDSFRNEDLLRDPDFHNVSEWLRDEHLRKLARRSLELGQENISKLHDLCRKYGIKLTVTVHPWRDQVMAGETGNLYVNSWKDYCRENSIDFINLYPVFINGRNPVLVVNQDYIKDDNHWNENGHRMVYEELVKHIVE